MAIEHARLFEAARDARRLAASAEEALRLRDEFLGVAAHELKTPMTSVKAATQLLRRVGLGERLPHRPGELSGGERQRAAVVRALINRPKLLLADEPTGALDRAAAHELAQLLLELNREEQVTLIVVTHAQDLARQMRRVLELRDGRLQESANQRG